MDERPAEQTELEQVRDYGEQNYRISAEALGPAVSLSQGAVDLYELMIDISVSGPAKVGTDDILALALLTSCKYELTMASLDVLRRHLLASYPHTRRAMELCAVAARVKDDLELVKLWLNAGESEDAYWAYWNVFQPRRIFPKDHPILGRLYKRYGECSRLSHPSVHSMAMQTEIKQNPERLDVRVDYFQTEPVDDLFQTFLWTLDTHFGILLVFQEVMQDLLRNDPKRWAIRRDAFDAQFGIEKEKLRTRLQSRPSQATSSGLIWTP